MKPQNSNPSAPGNLRATVSTRALRRASRIRGVGIPLLTVGIVTLAIVACGGNLTAGGFGEVNVTVSADAPEAASQAMLPSGANEMLSTKPSPDFHASAGSDHDDDPEGELEMEFLLFLIREDGGMVAVDDKEIEVQLDLAGSFEADAVTTLLPSARYVGLRIEFTEIEIEVDRGVIIDGVPVTGPIEIELEDDESITIERPLNAVLDDGGQIEILLDMNARVWLAAIDPDLRKVAERVFTEAIRVVVR